ncbi:MAG: FHA domain-containing protein [Gammaproteobacteria bacterium]|nr:FHA domain-containing protein [Gammaproteobacteria bacterium]
MSQLLINKDGFTVQEYELVIGSITIGRANDNDIQLSDPTISSHHAKIVTTTQDSYIEDLESTNGVFINGERIVIHALQADDVISIGKHEIHFLADRNSSVAQKGNEKIAQSEAATAGKNISTAWQVSTATYAIYNSKIADSTISHSTAASQAQEYAVIEPAEQDLRIVVDNTVASAKPHPLAIDISFDIAARAPVSGDLPPPRTDIASEPVKEKPYNDIRHVLEFSANNETDAGGGTNRTVDKNESFTVAVTALPAGHQARPVEIRRKTVIDDDAMVGSVVKPRVPPRLPSRQQLMSSEEVVKHLIALARAKNKTSGKSGGLSLLAGIVACGIIAAAIYYHLQ